MYWNAKRADACIVHGAGWSGLRGVSGTESVSPTTTTKYFITCVNNYGSFTDSATITVMGKAPTTTPPVTPPATTTPTLTLVASSTLINYGSSTMLAWNSTNANSCTASDGWSGNKAVSGNQSVSPTATTTYTLTCGNGGATTSQSVTINVASTSVPQAPGPILSFTATPSSITDDTGASSTLSWSSSNTSYCLATNGWSGSKGLSGSQTVSPAATTTYTLSCGGAGGTTTLNAIVNVTASSTPNPNPSLNHVVISEVYYDTASTSQKVETEGDNEWVELYNGTGSIVDLSGWTIGDNTNPAGDVLPAGTMIPNNGYLVITASSTTGSFWSIPVGSQVIVLSSSIGSNGLANGSTGDGVFLKNLSSTTIDAMNYGSNTTVFNPGVSTVAEGHSLYRTSLTTDTDAATDWSDNASPTPGM